MCNKCKLLFNITVLLIRENLHIVNQSNRKKTVCLCKTVQLQIETRPQNHKLCLNTFNDHDICQWNSTFRWISILYIVTSGNTDIQCKVSYSDIQYSLPVLTKWHKSHLDTHFKQTKRIRACFSVNPKLINDSCLVLCLMCLYKQLRIYHKYGIS